MVDAACSLDCDFCKKQTLLKRTGERNKNRHTIQVFYFRSGCHLWHPMSLHLIGLSYPTHYTHFDRVTALTGNVSTTSYYLSQNSMVVPRSATVSNKSAFVLCHLPQDSTDLPFNKGFMELVCNNAARWYGPIILFATDPSNHVRNVWPKDFKPATDTLKS